MRSNAVESIVNGITMRERLVFTGIQKVIAQSCYIQQNFGQERNKM